MSQTGIFGWIREGVRQSVLLGVSDAMEVIGTPKDPSQLHPALQSMAANTLQRIGEGDDPHDASAPQGTISRSPQRKRLGRSLKDLSPVPPSNPKSGS